MNNFKVNVPIYFYHEFDNDFPNNDHFSESLYSYGIEIAKFVLPIFSLYQPIGKHLALGTTVLRAIKSIKEWKNNSTNDNFKSFLNTAYPITTAAFGVIGKYRLGLIMIALHDIFLRLFLMTDNEDRVNNKKYLLLANNVIYLGSLISECPVITRVSLCFQCMISLSTATEEFEKENYLKALSNALIGIMRFPVYGDVENDLKPFVYTKIKLPTNNSKSQTMSSFFEDSIKDSNRSPLVDEILKTIDGEDPVKETVDPLREALNDPFNELLSLSPYELYKILHFYVT